MRIEHLLAVFTLTAPALEAQSVELVPRSIDIHFDGVDYARDGYLYFCGSWKGSQIFRGTPQGEIEVYADVPDGPTDCVMDSRGNLFVSNYNSTTITMVTPDREVMPFADTPLGPAGMAIDAEDNIYVTIYGSPAGEGCSVLKVTPQGEVSTYVESPDLHASVGLTMDDKGVLYVVNGRDGRVFRVRKAGQLELFSCLPLAFGRGGGGHLDWAGGLLFASSGIGALYAIDPNGAIHYVLREGTERTEAGPPVSPLLRGCNGLAAAPDGRTLYLGCITDSSRSLVRVDLDGAPPGSTQQDAWNAMQAGRFEAAEAIFQELAQADEVLPGVWFGLASLRYREREFKEAGKLYARAAKEPKLRANAGYNGACAYALAGDIDAAFVALAAAIEAGYADLTNMKADTDLATLRADPRWKDLVGSVEGGM